MKKNLFLTFSLCFVAMSLLARVAVYPEHASSQLGGDERGMFFTEQNARFTFNQSGQSLGEEPEWTLQPADGSTIEIDATLEMLPGQYTSRGSYLLDLGQLSAGDYALVWKWFGRQGTLRFIVRTGSEDLGTRRQYLRWKGTRAESLGEAETILQELATLEPTNPWVWEQLGWRALKEAPFEKAVAYFQKAAELARDNLDGLERERAIPLDLKVEAERRINSLMTVPRVASYYREHQHTLRIEPLKVEHNTYYVWIERSSGEVLGIVDPEAPGKRRPFDQRSVLVEGGASKPIDHKDD